MDALRVLMVEDCEEDAILVLRALQAEGWTVHHARVDTDTALRAALDREPWDVVLLDYNLPRFSPLTALQLVRQQDPDIPCIIVSGSISLTDEVAIQAMRAGAHDFVAKDRIARLPLVIRRERAAAAARRSARENEARLAAIVETAADAIVTIDERAIIETMNPAAVKLLGYTPEEAIGRNVSIFMPEPYHSEHQEYINRYLRTGEPHIIGTGREVEARRKDGTTFPIHLAVSEAYVGDRRIFTGIIHDITEPRRAQQATRRLAAIVLAADEAILAMDMGGRVTDWNPGAERLYGYSAAEMIGRSVSVLVPPRHPDELPRLLARLRRGESVPMTDTLRVRKDGSEVDVAMSAAPIPDEAGKVASISWIAADITARRRAEAERARLLEAAEAARDEAQEAAVAKDQFVAMVSHELRNPLNAITAGLYLLRQSCPTEGRAQRTLEIVERNAKLQARLVNDLLDLSRLQRGKLPLQRAPIDLAQVIPLACRTIQPEASEAALTLTCNSQPDLWVHGDEDRLHQVLMNILSNALKFTPPPGTITVTASRAGDWVRVEVTDTGIGISPDLLPHLFEVFSQGEIAAQRAAGLGLGLALVHGIVERHGGRVCAESEGVGKGTRFIVELPPTSPHAAAPRATPRTLQQQPCILIVEDNADTRTLLADALTLSGYDVRAAASGEEALDLLTEVTPDVLLVDVGLPGIDGYDFLRRARALPGMADVPAFAATGFGTQEDVQRGRDAGFLGHFVKPLDIPALDRRIRELLGLQPT